MDSAETRRFYATRGIGARVGGGARPAVLVVDLTLGFTDARSPLGSDLSREVAATVRLLRAARERGVPAHHTTIAFAPGLADGGPFLAKMPALATLIEGSEAVALDPRLERRLSEPLWMKKGASGFFGTGLAAAFTAGGIDTVIVAGCTTSGCVRASVVDACQHGFRTLVVREAVGDRAPGPHEASLFDMDSKYADVVSIDDAIAYLETRSRISRVRAVGRPRL